MIAEERLCELLLLLFSLKNTSFDHVLILILAMSYQLHLKNIDIYSDY
jgi:hypothetical protein